MNLDELAVEHHWVNLPALRMHFVAAGEREAPLVVLLHGFPENWWSWRYQIAALARAGYRVVAPDLRGYGETDKRGPYDLDTIAQDVCQLIESQVGQRAVRIVGHDWGGVTAWHLAALCPSYCERVAVLNAPEMGVMRKALIKKLSVRQILKSWYIFFFQLPWLPEWLLTRNDAGAVVRMLRASSVSREHFSAEELRPFRDAIQRPGAAKAMVGWYRQAIRAGLVRAPKELAPLSMPSMLIWGMQDEALSFDDLVPGTLARAPGCKLEKIENAGHFVHAEVPDTVNPLLLAFLAKPIVSPNALEQGL